MATLLLDTPQHDRATPVGATLKVLLSPVRGAEGQWRVVTQPLPLGVRLGDVLPAGQTWHRLICNGRVLASDAYGTYGVQPGDEVLAIPQWGDPITPWLIPLAIGLVVSIATTALSYLLFPPAKPHIQPSMDEPTFSFEGIRTTIGPGQVVPVIYGRHRVGGQLLSAAVNQAMTVIDTMPPGGRAQVQALSTPPTLTMLLALGEGPIDTIRMETLELNGQPAANFPGLETFWRIGTATQTPMPEFGETANTFADGRPIGDDPGITYTTTTPVQAFSLNIAFQEGLYYLTEKGQKEDNVSMVQYRYRQAGGAFGAWSEFEVAAARTSVVRFAIRREGLTRATYDIQLRFGGARIINELRARWQATLESVTEILHNTNAYPNTALLGLRAVATDALQGALPNVTVEVLGRMVRVGSFGSPPTWSDNPAWCLLDLLTHPRYGLAYPDTVMDLAAFAAWAAYCDQLINGEPRHRLNYVLDREMRAQPLLMELAGSARTILLKSEGLWTPRMTRDEAPVQLLSWTNVRNLTLTYSRDPDRINVMEGRFINEDQGFESDVQTWPVVEQWPVEVRKASLDLRGITKASRIQRALQFELNRRRFEVLSLEMDCAPDALVLQVHDIFLFAHPLPGWGTSGRVMPGSTGGTLQLDTPVTFEGGKSYHVYLRYQTDLIELRPAINPGPGTYSHVSLNPPFTFSPPVPYDCIWAFGESSPVDTAQRPFRVVRMARNADHSVHLQAIAHHPALYDEPEAEPLPEITTLFNPLGPAPPLTSLVLMEVTRVEPSGASLRVVNISWDVAPLSRGYAPYGGAMIQRRTVLTSTTGGLGTAGTQALGGALEVDTGNYLPLTQVSGHVLDFDDYTVITGTTYMYRVIPVSQRGVPNNVGALEGTITVTGPTTPDYFPGTPFNLRLKGKTPADTIFEGRDVDLEWDPPTGILFSETFFIQDYIMEVWAPAQLYLLRRTTIPAGIARQTLTWTYHLAQNIEDQLAAGQPGARRDLHFFLWARTNTNRISLEPGQLLVNNPPPDMGDMIPAVTALFEAALVSFDQFFEPRDFDHYTVYLDTVTPPLAIYEDVAIGPGGQGTSFRKLTLQGLVAGRTYYVFIWPYDTFGPGIPSQIASFVPAAIDADKLDEIPPAMPTGLTLTTGRVVSDDGTIQPWVEASWNVNTESDMGSYEIHFRLSASVIPTVFVVSHPTHHVRLDNIAGGITVFARLFAYDKFHNASPFTEEASITTSTDTVPPGVPTGAQARGLLRAAVILWTPPDDADYFSTEVWAANVNDLALAVYVGEGFSTFVQENLATGFTVYYWVRAKDTSGNVSAFVPGPTAGLPATTIPTTSGDIGNLSITETKIASNAISTPKLQANSVDANKVTTGELITLGAQIRSALITDAHIANITATKIISSNLVALVGIGVADPATLYMDGLNNAIVIFDDQPTPRLRVLLGKLGPLGNQYGLDLYNTTGQRMWHFNTGAQTEGIEDAAINAVKLQAGSVNAVHLRSDTVVITTALQLPQGATAIIDDAHIRTLAVDKILAGNLRVFTTLGPGPVGYIFLDGVNNLISIYDNQSPQRARMWMGKLGPGAAEYGMYIWNATGDLMWDFNSGVGPTGIQDNGVPTPKVQPDAITESLQFSTVTTMTATVAEVSVAGITFPTLLAGDQVLLWASGSGSARTSPGSNSLAIRIREDVGVSGTELGYALLGNDIEAPVVALAVYTASTTLVNKHFVLTMENTTGTDNVQMHHSKIVGLRRKR